MSQLNLFAVNPYGDPDAEYVPALDRLGRRWRIKLMQPCTGYGAAFYDEPGSTAVPGAGYELRWADKEYGPFTRITAAQAALKDTEPRPVIEPLAPGTAVEITGGMFAGHKGIVVDASKVAASDCVRVHIPGVGTPGPLRADVRPI